MKIIYKDGTVAECPKEEELHVLRHTAAHIMAQAIKRLYPQADFAFGPATENGFFYDVDLGDTKLSDEDLANIEKEMKKICKENLAIKPFILPRDEAVKLMTERQEHYKLEHMDDLADETEFSFYQQGEYVDMCIGPHLTYTKALKAFKITQQSGAYWKNDKENKMLTRINGVAFRNQEELEAWEKQQQEARERDHRKIGKEMRLFMTDDLVGRGLPMFLPNGYIIWQQLEDYIKGKERERGYLHVMTPCIGTVNLYKTSGHWDHYRENMFPAMEMEGESYVLRPMNCPHHMMIYANRPHSYRQLPIRIGEIAHDFRYESSGTLKGIERGRHFCQNDAHLFCTPEQIKSEVANVCSLIFDVYKDFNITDYRCVLSLRDPADKKKYHDDDAMWNHAENALREVLTELGINFTEEIGEAAFYGPKLDVNVKPAVGAEYTLSTCQLDFCLPAKFHLTYIDKDGSEKTPVVRHRVAGAAVVGKLLRQVCPFGGFPQRRLYLLPARVVFVPDTDRDRHRRVVPACRNICVQRVFRLRLRRFRRFRRRGSRFLCVRPLLCRRGLRRFFGRGGKLGLHDLRRAFRRAACRGVLHIRRHGHAGHGEEHQSKAKDGGNSAQQPVVILLHAHSPYPP